MNRIKRAWPSGAVGVAAAVVVLLTVARPWRGTGAPGEGAAVEAGAGKEAPPPAPLLRSEDVKWLSDATYVDDGGRMVSRYESDADELLLYGTLRYDVRTRADAPRIDLKPPGSRVFHSTRTPEGDRFRERAKRALRPDEDTAGDGLPDAWGMHWFGHLDYGPWDIHCRRFWAIQDRLAAERGEGGD